MKELRNVYQKRPFRTRNADEFALEDLAELFVEPGDGIVSPFEYENNIVKGKMGAGKTMFLRANLAYYLYSLVPSLLDGTEATLPVFIRLSDFQHLRAPDKIYRAIIIAILEQLCEIPQQLADARRLAQLHRGFQALPVSTPLGPKQPVLQAIMKLTADEYIERVSKNFGLRAGPKNDFFEASAEYRRESFLEVRGKESPGIADVNRAYRQLLGDRNGNILLLIDEAGALDRSFFTGAPGASLFETLMNQLRTAAYIRTKVAVYPHSYSDVLAETRYGDVVFLTEDVQAEDGYARFRRRALTLMDRYVGHASEGEFSARDMFDIADDGELYDDALEQAIYASGGNARRLILLLDQSMTEAFRYNQGNGRVRGTCQR